ncbi:MAG: DUF3558 domain-containing protein [Actinobacteria bacterium]|nr:DUF3558 domain-containing protein [Actinomycetota bacterium]
MTRGATRAFRVSYRGNIVDFCPPPKPRFVGGDVMKWFRTAFPTLLLLVGCGQGLTPPSATPQSSASPDRVTQLMNEEASKPKFDGIVQGVHIAPEDVLTAKGAPPLAPCATPARDLEPTAITDLDFVVTRPPAPPYVVRKINGPLKVACGEVATWVGYGYDLATPFGDGSVSVARRRLSKLEIGRTASAGRIGTDEINGKPAIVIRALDSSGIGSTEIIIVEDSSLDPWGRVLLLSSEWVTLEELRAIASGIK